MRQRLGQPGFTLVELVLVLLVIAVCAAIAAPSLSGFARGRALPNASQDLVTTTNWCRVKSLGDGVEYRLNFDKAAGKWWVTKDDGTGSNFVDCTESLGTEYIVPEGVSISSVEFKTLPENVDDQTIFISFRPGGRTDVATITLAYNEHYAYVACETPSGMFHITENKPQ
jgi:prepilin-type N-terminal cleavage/methylation domain-containing protein